MWEWKDEEALFNFGNLFRKESGDSFSVPSKDSESGFEVFEEDGTLHFKLDMVPIGHVKGEFSLECAHSFLFVWAAHIFERTCKGGSFEGSPFCDAELEVHPKVKGRTDLELKEMFEEFSREALIEAIPLMLSRLRLVPKQILCQALISILLDMEENDFVRIASSRADILNAQADQVAQQSLHEMAAETARRTRTWTYIKRRQAVKLYDDTLRVFQELKRTYFGSKAKAIRRKNPELKTWKQARAEYPHLANLLDRLSVSTPRELALAYVGSVFGSASEDYTSDQIKEGMKERKEAAQKPKHSHRSVIGRVVDNQVKEIGHQRKLRNTPQNPQDSH